MKKRMLVIPIETITALFKDYIGGVGFPDDAVPVKLMYRPTEMGKLALVVEAESFVGPQPPEEVRFELKRYYGVGN